MIFKRILPYLFLILLVSSCDLIGGSDDKGGDDSGTVSASEQMANEIADAKTFYSQNGAQFKFRAFSFNGNVENWHEMRLRKIFERSGKISFVAENWTSFAGTSYSFKINVDKELVLDAQGGPNFLHPVNENELTPENEMISYNYGSSAATHGGYGNANGVLHNFSQKTYQMSYMAQAMTGYMFRFKGKTLVFSMGLNSNSGRPSLFTLVPGATVAQDTWSLQDLEFIRSAGINFNNDASHTGNPNKIFWTWISYDALNTTNGKIQIVTYDGSQFGKIYAKSIGKVGETLSSLYKNIPTLHRNPNNPDQPYILVKHWDDETVFDVYKFTGTEIVTVVQNVKIPPFHNQPDGIANIAFTGSNIYLKTSSDYKIYKLKGSTFEEFAPGLNTVLTKVTTIEGGADGLYVGISNQIETGNLIRVAADLIFFKN